MAENEGIPEQGMSERPKRRYTRRTPSHTEARIKADSIRSNQIKTTGKILPSCPMTPAELVEQWEIGRDDVLEVTVKVLRQVIGEKDTRLVLSVPLVEYSGADIAANFGPGTYYLRPSAGQYAKNSAKLPISEEMARSCGWGQIPVSPQDLVAERTIRGVTQGPADPVDLMAAIQALMDRKFAEYGLSKNAPAQIQTSFDPMAAMQAQMAQMQTWMGFMDSMERSMQARVERRMGIKPEDDMVEKSESPWAQLIPLATTIFEKLMNRPSIPSQMPIRPVIPPSAAPNQQVPTQHQPTGGAMPVLTDEEKTAISKAVAMLRPFGSQLSDLGNSAASDDQIVAELSGYIPDPLIDSIQALNQIVQRHGKDVLSAIHPGVATDRWAGILPKLVEALL